MKTPFNTRQKKTRGQAIVEFMLVVPLLLILLYGIIEAARLAFIFSSVANASRQAARYGAGTGEVDDTAYYQDCEGIRDIANQSAILITFDEINITYDRGIAPDGSQIPISEDIDPSPDVDTCPIEHNIIRNGDRIIVQVSALYEPIIPLLPLEPMEIVSASARTFLVSVPIFADNLPMEFAPESPTPSRIPTSTAFGQETPSSPLPSPTSTFYFAGPPFQVNPTIDLPPALTPTPFRTPTSGPSPIACTGLNGIGHGPLIIRGNYMAMDISNNTGHVLTAAQIYVEWNHDGGHDSSNDRTLRLRQINFGTNAWNGDIFAPSAYIPGFYPTIPIGESTIQFVFHQDYNTTDGTERIIITIGNPGCTNYPIDSSK
jgi:hypothetical protein